MHNALASLAHDSIAIFLFHGVVDENTCAVRNYNRKHVLRQEFDAFVGDAKKLGVPLSMDEVLELMTQGEPLPRNGFAITFDDGFENNHSIAAPVLSDHGVPATFYITTDFIETNSMSWIDRIEYCFEAVDTISIKLPWGERTASVSREKIALLDEIRSNVKRSSDICPGDVAESVFVQSGLEPVRSSDHPLDLKMDWTQVRDLDESDLFTVGGHTHTHEIMSYLSPSRLDHEVSLSLELLKKHASISTHHYSYPEGQAEHYSENVVDALKKKGITICPTAIEGVNRAATNPFDLKRIMVA